MLKHTLVAVTLLLSSFVAQAQQTNETIETCQYWKDIMTHVLILRQIHTREELEPLLTQGGIDLDLFYPFLDAAYHLPVLEDPTQQEIVNSGILSMVYLQCLENDGFVDGVPQQ